MDKTILLFAVFASAFFVGGCTTTTGRQFDRPTALTLKIGETTRAQAVGRYGEARSQKPRQGEAQFYQRTRL